MIAQLNTSFEKNSVLHAAQLVAMKSKINEIIQNLSSESGDSGDVSKSYVDGAVQDAIDELTNLINQADQRLSARITTIENAQTGNTSEKTDEEWLEIFKKIILTDDDEFTEGGREIMNAAMFNMGVCNEQGQPYFSTTVQQNIENLGTRVSSLEVLPSQVSLLVEKRNGQDVIKQSAIIAAITDNDGVLSSTIGLSADKIVLDGDTLTTYLNSNYIKIGEGASEFNPDGSGHIANNKIRWDSQGNVTIDGDFVVGGRTVRFLTASEANNVQMTVSPAGVVTYEGREMIGCRVQVENNNNFGFYTTFSCWFEQAQSVSSGVGHTEYMYIDRQGTTGSEQDFVIHMEKPSGWDNSVTVDKTTVKLEGAYRYI